MVSHRYARTDDGGIVGSTPAVGPDGVVYFVSEAGTLYAVDGNSPDSDIVMPGLWNVSIAVPSFSNSFQVMGLGEKITHSAPPMPSPGPPLPPLPPPALNLRLPRP